MDGTDLGRRMGWSRQEAVARGRLALLWRRPTGGAAGNAAECLRLGREPLRRLEPLRRRISQPRH
jgi:hypothetical protein